MVDLQLRGHIIAVISESSTRVESHTDNHGAVGKTVVLVFRVADHLWVRIADVFLNGVENILVVGGEDHVVEILDHGWGVEALGISCSFFFPEWLARIFITFNGLFANFLGFFVPVLIFALITPAIAGLGRGAGKWLGITAGIAYSSTVISGLIAWGLSAFLYPWLLGDQTLVTDVDDVDAGGLSPFFEVEIPAPFEVMTALISRSASAWQ